MKPAISLVIIHAAHIPERVPLYERLVEQLELAPHHWHDEIHRGANPNVVRWRAETTRAPWPVWSELAWSTLAEDTVATHGLFLQDDVTVPENFWQVLRAMVEGRPDDVIGLDCAHPAARSFFVEGKPGFTTCDGMIGIGGVMSVALWKEFLAWRTEAVKPVYLSVVTEDTLIALWCLATGRKIFHPTPTIIDHDLEIPSTNEGFDEHMYRRPQATWLDFDRVDDAAARSERAARMLDPAWWAQPVEHVGRFYEPMRYLATALTDTAIGAHRLREVTADVCPPARRRFFMRVGA